MKLQITPSDLRWFSDVSGEWLCVRTPNAMQFLEQLEQEKDYDFEIKPHIDKRSRDANNYFWHLLDELAMALKTSKQELYLQYIKKYGQFKDFNLTENEAKTFCVVWSAQGTGWPTERLDYAKDGERVVIRAYYGSSTYSAKRMNALIEQVVMDCQELGIETMTENELAAIKGAKREH